MSYSIKSRRNNGPVFKNYLRMSFLFVKWNLRHRIPFLNTTLMKQIRQITQEISSKTKSHSMRNKQKNILFFTMRQDPPHLAWNSVLAMALMIRGHSVKNVACDGFIRKACNSGQYPDMKRNNCSLCKLYAKQLYKISPIFTNWLSDFAITEIWEKAETIIKNINSNDYESFCYKNLPIGRLAESSTVHFLREGVIGLDNESRHVYHDFICGGIAMVDICEKILNHYNPDIVIMLNGWFITERVMLEMTRQKNIKVMTYENGFRSNTLYFCENEPIKYEIDAIWKHYCTTPLEPEQNNTLDHYLNTRESGDLGWAVYKLIPQDAKLLKTSLGLEQGKKTVVAFASIAWDSTLWKLDIGFSDMIDWLKKTMEYFIKNPQSQLLIRLHPGEVVSKVASRDSVGDKLRASFQHLPSNIKIIEPTSNINSYTLMGIADIGLVYTSTTGLEMAIKGKPVIVAGNPHYRNKGFTYDPESLKKYIEFLDSLLKNVESETLIKERIELARRYAYRLFFNGSIPFSFVEEKEMGNIDNQVKLKLTSADELSPGKDKWLDNICDTIISGYKFKENN